MDLAPASGVDPGGKLPGPAPMTDDEPDPFAFRMVSMNGENFTSADKDSANESTEVGHIVEEDPLKTPEKTTTE